MTKSLETASTLDDLPVALERDLFLRNLIHHLSGTLQDVVGLEEAAGFISVVGQNIGRELNDEYKLALGVRRLSRDQLEQVLLDLKSRIKGDFYIIESDEEKIVFGNRVCPFEKQVVGRPSMCMMTSNVFGSIAADNLGYAKVVLQETIANGANGCRIVVYLDQSIESDVQEGREYYSNSDDT